MNRDAHYRKWLAFAPLGLATIGFGLSLTNEATLRKGRGESWVLYGTVGLCVTNVGVSIFGDAVKERALYELNEKAAGTR